MPCLTPPAELAGALPDGAELDIALRNRHAPAAALDHLLSGRADADRTPVQAIDRAAKVLSLLDQDTRVLTG